MRMEIVVTCSKCGKHWEDKAWIRDYELNNKGGTIDTDCPWCGRVVDGSIFTIKEV